MEIRGLAVAAKMITILGLACLVAPAIKAQANPGDPLFCDPDEGVTFLIVNGGSGVFTVNADCLGNNPNNARANNPSVITTTQGGTLTQGPGTSLNYTYAPPTPGFTGLDTFTYNVTTTCNRAGGPGSAGNGASPNLCPGGPATLTITLNVLPATMSIVGTGAPILIPIPASPVTGCPTSVSGQANNGPSATEVVGCVTGVVKGFGGVNPAHGSAAVSGNTILYTPNGTANTDTFTVQAVGVDTDTLTSLNSGNITVNITAPNTAAPVPTLGMGGMALLCSLLLLFGAKAAARRMA